MKETVSQHAEIANLRRVHEKKVGNGVCRNPIRRVLRGGHLGSCGVAHGDTRGDNTVVWLEERVGVL